MSISNSVLLFVLVLGYVMGDPTARTVTFINQCDVDYWIGPEPNALPGGPGCSVDADCGPGADCEGNICHFTTPTPNTGTWTLPSQGVSKITFPFYNDGRDSQWAGNFGFCNEDMTCLKSAADCASEGCIVFQGPYTQGEINFVKQGQDFYDVSLINGLNVPIMIAPTAPSVLAASNPYHCAAPGSPLPSTVGAASWKPQPPSIYYQWVKPSNKLCISDDECGSDEHCGLTSTPGAIPNWKMSCGKLIGWWSANQVCVKDADGSLLFGPFDCFTGIDNLGISSTIGGLQGCNGVSGSGYSDGADRASCGCVDWSTFLGPEVVPLLTQNCTNTNPLWITFVLPTIQWLKELCPTCYSYPYDDPSSTFKCEAMTSDNNWNTQNYTITLCPNGPIY